MLFAIQHVRLTDGRRVAEDYVAASPRWFAERYGYPHCELCGKPRHVGKLCDEAPAYTSAHPQARFAMSWDTAAEAEAFRVTLVHADSLEVVEVPDRVVSLLTSYHWGPKPDLDKLVESTRQLKALGLW